MKDMQGRGVYMYKEGLETGNAMPDAPKAKASPQSVRADKSQSAGGYKKDASKSGK